MGLSPGAFMSFMTRIVEREPAIFADLRGRDSGRKTVLYGAANMGRRIHDVLLKNGISIDIVAVDDSYAGTSRALEGRDVVPLARIAEGPETYDYIVGFSGFSSAHENRIAKSCGALFNYDIVRGVPDEGSLGVSYDYYKTREEELEWFAARLHDERSREVLAGYINQRISGKYEYCRQFFSPDQYFQDFVPLHEDEVFVDCGAWNGDSVLSFLAHLGKRVPRFRGKIHALEPDREAFALLVDAVKDCDCVCHNVGAWDEDGVLEFKSCRAAYKSSFSLAVDSDLVLFDEIYACPVKTIDGLLGGDRATFIKMDVEGSELRALHGARQSIERHRPSLAVCLYHKIEDIFTIPRFVHSLRSDYKLYVRWHGHSHNELVLYAV